MNITFLDLKAAAVRVIDSGWYVLGEEATDFEGESGHGVMLGRKALAS
jgi:hypothetical protein